MVWCNHCAKHVPVIRPDGGRVACDLCGKVLEDFHYSEEVTFIKNAAGQSQASGNYVNSVQTGISSSRERRLRIARDEIMHLSDALGISDEGTGVVDMAVRFFTMAADTNTDKNFTRGRRTELVQSSCLYLACREKKIPILLIDISSYLRVSVYELGIVYLQFCKKLCLVENQNYAKLVDPSIFIPRFTNILFKGAHDKAKYVADTAKDIIASMKRDWMQTGRKPNGVCGAAIYIAALSHHIMCSRTDIGKIVHMCEATITKRLNEFANTDAASLNVDELTERERERESRLHKETFTTRPDSDKGEVICKHKGVNFGYGLCKNCHIDFIEIFGGFVGGSDPPAFQRAEKERMEKAAREENEGGIEKSEGEAVWDAEALDESGNLSDLDGDKEVDDCLNDEEEVRMKTAIWELQNPKHLEEAAKEAALKRASEKLNASNANCPEYARNLVEASKASVAKSRKEKRQKRAEEAKNAPPPATAMEAVTRMLENKRLRIDYDALEELLGTTSPVEKSPKRWKKSNEHEDNDEEMSLIF